MQCERCGRWFLDLPLTITSPFYCEHVCVACMIESLVSDDGYTREEAEARVSVDPPEVPGLAVNEHLILIVKND
jgi:hypothetical protein